MCIVGDGDGVGWGIVADTVDTRHFVATDGIDAELLGSVVGASRHTAVSFVHLAFRPRRFTV